MTDRAFSLARDGLLLVGRLLEAGGQRPAPAVVFVHGLGSDKDSPRNVTLAVRLSDLGIASVLFDLSGHGESGADGRPGVAAYVDDLAAVFGWTAEQPEVDPRRVAVAGSSLGAAVALRATTSRRISPAALVLRAPAVEEEDFAGLAAPSLAVVGSEDPLLMRVRRGVAASPWAALAVVDGAGHLFEEPGALAEAVRLIAEWLEARLTAAATRPA